MAGAETEITNSCSNCGEMMKKMDALLSEVAEDRAQSAKDRAQERAEDRAQAAKDRVIIDRMVLKVGVLEGEIIVLKEKNGVLEGDNIVLTEKIVRMEEKDAFLENEVVDLKAKVAELKEERREANRDNVRVQSVYIDPMQCIHRRILVTSMRDYLVKVTNEQPGTGADGLPLWQAFIINISNRADVSELTGFSKSQILYLNEAVSPGGDAHHVSTTSRMDLLAAVHAIRSPEIKDTYKAYYNQVVEKSNLIPFDE